VAVGGCQLHIEQQIRGVLERLVRANATSKTPMMLSMTPALWMVSHRRF